MKNIHIYCEYILYSYCMRYLAYARELQSKNIYKLNLVKHQLKYTYTSTLKYIRFNMQLLKPIETINFVGNFYKLFSVHQSQGINF